MAKKKATTGSGGTLVIVESPAKARTIRGYLGDGFTVEASIGHVRDLPQNAKQIPAKYKGEDWARLGVNVDEEFEPIYVVSPGKNEQVKKLKSLLADSQNLLLATDEDREGEAISWHLVEILKPKVPVRRLVFHEITREAIREALDHPREIDERLVQAQEARRIIDRLYGYEVSPLLWKKVGPRLSAGRVQSVAVRLIVQRERERIAFVSAEYWDLLGDFAADGQGLQATLVEYEGRKLPSGKDFDSNTGKLKKDDLLHLDEAAAVALADKLRGGSFTVRGVEEKPEEWKPKPPFTTSTMQQEANRKLGFTARRTMQAAQGLYENGHITYMRTDSVTLAKQAVDAARGRINSDYGPDYLPPEPRSYRTKVKNAQEAHEAIRPAGANMVRPDELRSQLKNDDEYKLYDLIWKRTAACQMANAKVRRIVLTIEGEGALFQVSGKTIDFPGYLRAYVEGSDDPSAELADQETVLPQVTAGQSLNVTDMTPKGHATQPPARYTEAALTRALEEKGIGRPSTYASIIETILNRDYVFKRGSALVPTWTAFVVVTLLERHLTDLIDYDFTAQLEDDLDAISRGERERVEYLRSFYHGNGKRGLKQQLEHKAEEIDARHINQILVGEPTEGEHTDPIYVRVGRYGPFLQQGEDRRASLPDEVAPDELTVVKAVELLEQAQQGEEPLGVCPETNRPVYLKTGRFGPYVQLGSSDDEEKPKNASLLKNMKPEDVDFDTALKLLSLPREVGVHPTNGEKIVAHNGRFGPYIKCGDETRSLGADLSPLDVTLEKSVELLAQPKKSRKFGAAREPLKTLGESPVTKQSVNLFDGRYGPYVTDGETNASVPKDADPQTINLDQALALLAARAAAGGSKKKKKAKKKTTKKAAKKKTAKKKATKKTAAKKKAATSGNKDDAPF